MDKITFKDLGLSKDVLKGIEMMGYVSPSPIQEKSIPVLLEGKDIIGQAQTGTGKTLAFGSVLLSTIEKNNKQVQALILSPTRELALQIHEELKRIGKYTDLSIVSVFGGSEIDKQIKNLKRGADIVVGTPGRVQDLMRRKVLKIDHIQWMVLDEADEMLNMGFIEDIENILQATPAEKRTILFSATMPSDIKKIASNYMQEDYMHIQIKSKTKTASTVSQYYFEAAANQKFEALCRILDSREMGNTIIFCKTKRSVDEIVAAMQQKHYNVEAMHGDLSQNQRMNTLKRFKSGQVQYLVATDVAARGIDVDNISHVINYEMPQDEELYIHRIGRTGRANKKGEAYSIVTNREKNFLMSIQKRTNSHIEAMPIPSNQDIFDQKIKELLFDVQEEMLKGNLEMFEDIVKDIPSNMKNEVLATLLSMCYQQRVGFDYKEDMSNRAYDRIFMTAGSMDKISVKDIIDFFVKFGKIKKSDIGDVTIKRKFTFVDIKTQVSQKAVKGCHNQKINRRKVRLEFASEK
ncbi:DEAD/DEAH box helicase [Longibaculum muris]|uniref:DEAD/DEAH box helicase n=1 Tax=Longibaculum muris TaxID=1796628 RepID=UPI0022E0E497|nr:DEAD/DEAH box helicase [Longibaculum muris]